MKRICRNAAPREAGSQPAGEAASLPPVQGKLGTGCTHHRQAGSPPPQTDGALTFLDSSKAFTLVELIVITAMICVLLELLIPMNLSDKQRAKRVQCSNNLKMIGLAFKTWPVDSMDGFPMENPESRGGTRELVGTGLAFVHLQAMSNELSTPKILVCPSDTRSPVKDFRAGFSNTNLSYFVGIDANDAQPGMLLSGDRNLTNGLPLQNGIMVLMTNSSAGWTRELHECQGNVVLADGSVQQLTSSRLRVVLNDSGCTNRLAIP